MPFFTAGWLPKLKYSQLAQVPELVEAFMPQPAWLHISMFHHDAFYV
jgi:hypothetical protein